MESTLSFYGYNRGHGNLPIQSTYDRVLWEYAVPGPLVRAIRSLYKQSANCVRILGTKSSTFSVGVGLRQDCPLLSPILFVIFTDRISRRSRGEESVLFRDLRIASLLFADNVVLWFRDLQHALGRFAVECEAVGMRVSTSKSEAMVLCPKTMECSLRVGQPGPG